MQGFKQTPFAIIAAIALCGLSSQVVAKTVYLDLDVELDQVAPEDAKMYRIGGHDLDRIGYDDASVDPATHHAKITYLAHFILGHWAPTSPVDASFIDLSAKPYKLRNLCTSTRG
jgi:hypothetical protein